jgi:hypothetical protein
LFSHGPLAPTPRTAVLLAPPYRSADAIQNKSETTRKLDEALNTKQSWGASSTLLNEIADLTMNL